MDFTNGEHKNITPVIFVDISAMCAAFLHKILHYCQTIKQGSSRCHLGRSILVAFLVTILTISHVT